MISSFDFFDGAGQAQVFRFMLDGGNHSKYFFSFHFVQTTDNNIAKILNGLSRY